MVSGAAATCTLQTRERSWENPTKRGHNPGLPLSPTLSAHGRAGRRYWFSGATLGGGHLDHVAPSGTQAPTPIPDPLRLAEQQYHTPRGGDPDHWGNSTLTQFSMGTGRGESPRRFGHLLSQHRAPLIAITTCVSPSRPTTAKEVLCSQSYPLPPPRPEVAAPTGSSLPSPGQERAEKSVICLKRHYQDKLGFSTQRTSREKGSPGDSPPPQGTPKPARAAFTVWRPRCGSHGGPGLVSHQDPSPGTPTQPRLPHG